MDLEKMQAISDDVCDEWEVCPAVVTINRRLRRLAGQHKAEYDAIGLVDSRIEMSGWVLKDADEAEAVLRHELAHHVATMKFGRGISSHGAQWKAVAMRIGGAKAARPYFDTVTAALQPAPNVYFTCPDGCEITGYRKPRRNYAATAICRKHLMRFARA